MGWTQTAPSVKTWEQERPTNRVANYFTVNSVQSIGRTSGKGFAIKVVFTVSNGSYGSFTSPGNYVLTCTINGTGTAFTTDVAVKKGTATFYYVGEAESGAEIGTVAGGSNGSKFGTLSFTAPKTNGNVYVNVNGTWKEATMFVNVGGTWKEAQAKINVGGEWK